MKDKIDHLSVSQVNEYLGCSQQYYYHRIAKLEACDVSSSLVAGSAFHAAAEYFNVLKKKGIKASLSEMTELFRQYVSVEEKESIVNWGKGCRNDLLLEGERWLESFLEAQDKKAHVVKVEERFEIMLPGIPVPIVGRVDVVLEDHEGDICVVDYKTASTKPSEYDIENNLQMTLYGLWAKRVFPNRQIKLRMDYLVKSKRCPKFLSFETSRSEFQEQSLCVLFRKVYNHIAMLRAEVIDPLPVMTRKCFGCGFRHACQDISKVA